MLDKETQRYFEELEDSQNEVDIELAKSGGTMALRSHTGRNLSEEAEGQLTIDVYQTLRDIIIESTIAGVKPEDLDIDITNESVTVRGKREKEERIKEGDYIYQECYWGRFSRSIILPQEIDPDSAEASLKNGILTIRLPKLDRNKTKKIKVRFD